MSRYKINENSILIKKNPGGGPNDNDRLFIDSRSLINEMEILLRKIRSLTPNMFGKYICNFKYKAIPSKSSRMSFGVTFQNLGDIQQRGVFTTFENQTLYTRLFYEFDESNINWLIASFEEVINASSENDISGTVYRDFLNRIINKSILSRGKPASMKIVDIESNIVIENFEEVRAVRVLPIWDIINYLEDQGIFDNQNFDRNIMVAYLNYEQIQEIINSGQNIFYSSNAMNDFNVNVNLIDGINDEIIITGRPNEKIIGVIDSGNILSGDFTRYIDRIEDHRQYGLYSENYHGSNVASLIIANDELNPTFRDGLGNFKIRHFTLLEPFDSREENEGNASVRFMHLMDKIPEIVRNNPDIKVWNLSLGGLKIPYSRTISEHGKMLDKVANEHDVIFVVASGNDGDVHGFESLNSPGDSLNSITVGSSKPENNLIRYSDYSSIGPILHYEKPEVSHFGGPLNKDGSPMVAFDTTMRSDLSGTSFSTPRVSRMVAKYISEGLTPQEAKAKVISMAVREMPRNRASAFGYIGEEQPKIELNLTLNINNKNPRYIPVNIPENTERIKISIANTVDPKPEFGEEYSIQNFEAKMIAYDITSPEPEQDRKSKTIVATNKRDSKYQGETIERFERGKYFNSSIWETNINKINEAKRHLVAEKFINELDVRYALWIKKLDLFETIEDQNASVSMIVSIYGESINIDEFERNNAAIIEAEIIAEV